METKVISEYFSSGPSSEIDAYIGRGGYRAAETALRGRKPEDILNEVKRAWLRGRGGAGFPAGVKWGFVPAGVEKPKYLCINADEGEPGTFKDRAILSRSPHLLIEGALIAAYCVGIHSAFIYIRGEYEVIAQRVEAAISQAYERGYLGKDIFGTQFDLDIIVHRGAGGYICGEETALLESLEGKRGEPRLKPPFPASVGLFGCPTVVNNVETLSLVPSIIQKGAAWFVEKGLPLDGGTKLFSLSGAVRNPGLYELPVGTRLTEIIYKYGGGLEEGKKLKAVIPGGMSAPILRPDEIEVPADFDSLARAGSMLGSGAVIVIDEETPILAVLRAVTRFFSHESCGQCTPCRVGTSWIHKIVSRMSERRGEKEDIETILRLAAGIKGKTLCPLGDAAALPILALVQKFRAELESSIPGESRG